MSINYEDIQTISGGENPPDTVRVWDIMVRVFHWSLVTIFTVTWLTSDNYVWLHVLVGYGLLGLIGFRLIWGVIGGKHARFTDFVKSPKTILTYLKHMREGRAARYLGHNPAGGAMIITLLLTLTATGVTGWMSTTDRWWGISWVENLHVFSAYATIVLVLAHIAGVIYTSREQNENLVKAMITGRKKIER